MAALTESLSRVRVVLVEPEYNGNLGQVARALRNFGLSRLVLVGGRADPDSDEARWYARAEGQVILDQIRRCTSLEQAVADCRTVIGTSRRVGHDRGPGEPPETVFRDLAPWRTPWETAIVFGREANGLHSHELDLCQRHILIPTDEACPSLNLSHAVAVTGYALSQAARADQESSEGLPNPAERAGAGGAPIRVPFAPAGLPPAAHDVLEAMYAHARRVWLRIGYIQTPKPATFIRRWRRIFGRARLTESDVRIVRALLHQTDWVAEIAGLPQGGAREAPKGVFDKHRVHLQSSPEERPPASGRDPAPDGEDPRRGTS